MSAVARPASSTAGCVTLAANLPTTAAPDGRGTTAVQVTMSMQAPTRARSTPPPSAVSSAETWARPGPAAAATQARDAPGSAVSTDRVPNATTGTSMPALQLSPPDSGVPPSAAPAATSAT